MPEYSITIKGTPEEVQAMLNAGSKVEPRFFRKKKISPGEYILWYRCDSGENAPNDLMMAIKRRAGLMKKKSRPKPIGPSSQEQAEVVEDASDTSENS